MASLAETLLSQSAQTTAANPVGAGLPEGMKTGIEMARMQQQLVAQKEELQMKRDSVNMAKADKLNKQLYFALSTDDPKLKKLRLKQFYANHKTMLGEEISPELQGEYENNVNLQKIAANVAKSMEGVLSGDPKAAEGYLSKMMEFNSWSGEGDPAEALKSLAGLQQVREQAETQRLAIQEQKQDTPMLAGQKKLDTEFAVDYNEWTSGGKEIASSEINKLGSVLNDLKSGKVTTGGVTGIFPDRLTSAKVLRARTAVTGSIMASLRQILGTAFTEKEGERVIKNTWSEEDSTENNIERLGQLITDLRAKATAKSQKADYFSKSGTLSGFTPKTATSVNTAEQSIPTKQSIDVEAFIDNVIKNLGGKESPEKLIKSIEATLKRSLTASEKSRIMGTQQTAPVTPVTQTMEK